MRMQWRSKAVGVGEGDAAHGTDACVVEGLESAQKVLAQAPDLAVVQQDGKDQGYVDPALTALEAAEGRFKKEKECSAITVNDPSLPEDKPLARPAHIWVRPRVFIALLVWSSAFGTAILLFWYGNFCAFG